MKFKMIFPAALLLAGVGCGNSETPAAQVQGAQAPMAESVAQSGEAAAQDRAEIDVGSLKISFPGLVRSIQPAAENAEYSKASAEYDQSVSRDELISQFKATLEDAGYEVRVNAEKAQLRAIKGDAAVLAMVKARADAGDIRFKSERAGGLVSIQWMGN